MKFGTVDMGLTRALTKRFGRPNSPDEAAKLKPTRPAISMPMGLISTTNQSVHDNPNISPSQIRAIQDRQISSSSGSSLNESDENASSSPDTPAMTDASSVESYSPIEPNHLTQYFPSVKKPSESSSPALSITEEPKSEPEPEIQPQPEPQPELLPERVSTQDHMTERDLSPPPSLPKRAPSHSKREHERLARVRSVRSSTGSPTKTLLESTAESPVSEKVQSTIEESKTIDLSIAPLRSSRPASVTTTQPITEAPDFNPFSKELLALDEVAEEFSAYSSYSSSLSWEQECAEDLRVMREKGLSAHRASEYLRDISALRSALWDVFEEKEDSDDDEEETFHDAVSDWI